MTLALSSFSPAEISYLGGQLIEVRGTFTLGNRHYIYIGDTGLTLDPRCYSGVPGQGYILYPVTTSLLRAYSPYLSPSETPYRVLVKDLDADESQLLFAAVTARLGLYYGMSYGVRRVLPLHWLTGPRDIEQEPDA